MLLQSLNLAQSSVNTLYLYAAAFFKIYRSSFVFFGYLADKVGYKIVMFSAAIILAVVGYPLYMLMINNPTVQSLLIAQIGFAILGAGFIGPVMGVLSHLFSPRTRFTALSFSYNLGFGLFAGTATLL